MEEGYASAWSRICFGILLAALLVLVGGVSPQQAAQQPSSYAPVVITEDFATIMARMKAAKAEVMKRQMDLLNERYDLSNRPAADGTTMSRGKPVQEGVRVKLPAGVTWAQLAAMTPADIRDKGLFPKGFLPTAASPPRRRRYGVSRLPYRRDQTAGRARSHPLRSRFRSA